MSPDALLALFEACAAAQRGALAGFDGDARRDRTERAGQYALDVVADAAILPLLHAAELRVLSEESLWSGPADAAITVVVDPVDGSTNCARGIPYWAFSICALDADGPLCALVTNSATGRRFTAIRGQGAHGDGRPLRAAATTRIEDSVLAYTGAPTRELAPKQYRVLGSTALTLCDVAAGGIDAWVDFVDGQKPWDYLGGLLVAREAGAVVRDVDARELVVADAGVTRQIVAAATEQLADELLEAIT